MKSIQLIVSDLDGTLLDDGAFANQQDVEMLRCLQAQEYKVILATGRSWFLSNNFAKELTVDKNTNLMICNNGAIVTKVSEYHPIYEKLISANKANELLAIANALNLCFYAFVANEKAAYDNGVPCPSINLTKNEWVQSFTHWDVTKKPIEDGVVSQIMIFTPENNEKAFLEASSRLRKELACNKSDLEDVAFYEFNNLEASKGNALKFVCEHLKVKPENVVAFGDNFNDISMFDTVGTAVAIAGANDTVKAHANIVTDSVQEGGVSNYLNQVMLSLGEN